MDGNPERLGSGFRRSGALECVPGLLVGSIERLAQLRQGRTQGRPGFAARLLQLLQSRFGLRCVGLHLLDRRIDVGALRRCDLGSFVMELVRRFVPSLRLRGRYVSERCLLLLDLLADSLNVGFELRFEAMPLQLELRLGSVQGGFTCLSLCLGVGLKLMLPLFQIGEQMVGLCLRVGFQLAYLCFERRQCSVHFVNSLFGPVQVYMHTAMLLHDRLRFERLT